MVERVRTVVYLERTVRDALIAEGRERGLTFCEVVRERLELSIESSATEVNGVDKGGASKRRLRQRGTAGAPGELGAGVLAERRVGNHPKSRDMADYSAAESPSIERKGKTCKHGKSKGYYCWQCGGLAVIE